MKHLALISVFLTVSTKSQKNTEAQFASELQILAWKAISICSEWKTQVGEVLKT